MLDIDPDITVKERTHINNLITSEVFPDASRILHPSMPSEPALRPTELMRQELDRKAAGLPITEGIDLSRYEAPESPSDDSDVTAWKRTLQTAYTSSTYLSGRISNLPLLEDHGRNVWLIANYQLEGILRQLEKELEELKSATENVNKSRKAGQEDSRGEITGLEETWKRGIGRILEVEVGVEEIRQQILEKRRVQAG
jgi:pre-mRNA-splicing factor SPF27